ncbi:MAG: di-heme oxidoredictase family protein [Polyangiales bacterium]|nr:c-type cytochrome [Myxococcales bacterium]MCB9657934.1 c-type cytochrome [Sandaracinaceae bacterium]
MSIERGSVRRTTLACALACVASIGAGCGGDAAPVAPGIFAPLGEVMPRATEEQRATFARGRALALRPFAVSDGLGPPFNVSFCLGCHEKPVFGGAAGHYRDFLLVAFRDTDGAYVPRGVNGVQVQFLTSLRGRVAEEPFVNVTATRNPIPFFGVGALAEITDEEILSRADPDDRDGDGISGRANFDRGFVGRFGRKSQTVSIEGFIRGPLFNHLGITSVPLTNEARQRLPLPSGVTTADAPLRLGSSVAGAQAAQAAAPDEPNFDADAVPDPELSPEELFDIVAFTMLLAAPEPDAPTVASERGERHFHALACATCHTPALRGPHGLVPAYSDLLLHDMGPELADGIQQALATGSEFRTQPLWGVVAVAPYLHDGRASTLDEAIRAHGGEAQAAREAYEALSSDERDDVIAFLSSLGGAREHTDGLLPAGAPLVAGGQLGAPRPGLGAAELEQFTRGRAVFDRDMTRAVGLGPRFNGDSCRACHFQPAIGGAGPLDVDVIRNGQLVMDVFTAPAGGTILHRHDVSGERPAPEPGSNFFEPRQTPSLFGLGLVDRIPEATLQALADPDDADMDGISGRAHVLPDGRVGRFGWKAQVPSLAEFARDALSAEVGITLPPQAGATFGALSDGDAFPDPEISVDDIEDLVAFMVGLDAPARGSRDAPTEALGESLFGAAGCAACHVPSLTNADGVDVRAYSDFLLHDVASPLSGGIVDGDATTHEFRTAPLWGLSHSAPYMHHGRAETVREAIGAHSGEAEPARLAFEALTEGDQAALLAFLAAL